MRVLCLNKSYIPIRLTSPYTAIGKFYCGIVEAIRIENGSYAPYDFSQWLKLSLTDDWPSDQSFINAVTQRIAVPNIIRCLKYDKIPKVSFKLCRKNVYERDNHTCYLCGNQFSESSLSIDHIVPTSRGGFTTWENIATCCKQCNWEKGDKLLAEMQIRPKYKAVKPVYSNMLKLKKTIGENSHPDWVHFGL